MRAIIIHGTKGSPEGNWFQWLKRKLESDSIECYTPTMPTPENQTKDNWLRALKEQTPAIDKNTILIGHSCGANFILHILETLGFCIRHTALVGCVIHKTGDVEIDTLNDSFINHTFDWDQIKQNSNHFSLMHGDNDPYVPLKQPLEISRKLDIPLTVIPDGGHLNADSGYETFELLYKNLRNFISSH